MARFSGQKTYPRSRLDFWLDMLGAPKVHGGNFETVGANDNRLVR